MDILKKLLMMKEIRFEEGVITLLNNRTVMNSISLPVGIGIFLEKNPEMIPKIYEEIKEEHRRGWGKTIDEKYKMKPIEYLNEMFETSNLAGWGKTEFVDFDESNTKGTFRTLRAPIAEALKGKAKLPTEHLWRGMAAGTASVIFKKNLDFIETKCLALGSNYCEYKFFPRKKVTSEIKKEFGYQVNFNI